MSDLDLSGEFNLDSSGGIGGLDDIANSLSDIDAAAASAGASISDSMNQAASSFEELSSTASEAYSAIESGAASAGAAASELGGAAKEAGAGAQEAAQGFSILDGITLGAGIAAVESMQAAAMDLLQTVTDTVNMYGELEAASAAAAMRSTTATTTEGYIAATQAVLDKSLQLAPQVGIQTEQLAGILSTYTGPTSGLSSMHALADITSSTPSAVYGAERLLGKQFGETDYEKMGDALAKGFGKTGIRPEDIGGRTGAALAGLGMDFNEAVATVGVLKQEKGYEGSQVAMALANADARLAKSSSEIEMKLVKGNAKKGTSDQIVQDTDIYGAPKMKYEGLGKGLTEAGLDANKAKAQGLEATLVQMYQKGIDFSTVFSGKQGQILHDYAAMQAKIQGVTTEMDNSAGTATKMGGAIDDTLKEMTEEATISIDAAKANFGSLFDEPAKAWQEAVKGIADSISGLVDRIKTVGLGEAINEMINSTIVDASGLGGGIIDSLLGGISSGASKIATGIYDILAGIDYKQVGWALYDMLDKGWDWAVKSLEGMWDSASFETLFTKPVKAISDMVDPIMTSMKLSIWEKFLEIEALTTTVWQNIASAAGTTFNSAIDSIGGMVNVVVGGIGEVVATAIESFASLVGAAGTALQTVNGETTGEQYTKTTSTKGATNTDYYIVNNPDGSISLITTDKSAANARLQELYGSSATTIQSAGPSWSGRSALPALDQMYHPKQEGTWNPNTEQFETSTGTPMVFAGEGKSTTPAQPSPEKTTSGEGTWNPNTEQFENTAGQGLIFANEGSGRTATGPTLAQSLKNSETQLNEIAEGIRSQTDGFKSSDYKVNVALPKTYEENLADILANATDYNKERLAFDNAQLAAQEKALAAVEKLGDKADIAALKTAIDQTKDKLSGDITAAATSTPGHIPGLYYGTTGSSSNWQDYVNSEGGYAGPTKYYPGYKDPMLADQQEAAAINAKYGIGGLGSIGQVDVAPKIDTTNQLLTSIDTTLSSPAPVGSQIGTVITPSMDFSKAQADLDKFTNMIKNLNPVIHAHVQVDADASQIRAAVERAIASEMANVRMH
jgi:hypothetical protein